MKIFLKDRIVLMLMIAMIFVAGCTPEENNDSDVRVTTYTPQDITQTSAVCGGDVIVTQGLSMSAIGVCWSTERNPTAEDDHLSTTKWNEPYVCTIKNLEPGTNYHVRAYALRGLEYYYGEDKTFTTEENSGGGNNGGGNTIPTGAINGKFTINSSGNKVYFSQGNLQYIGISGTWKFADDQWEIIGAAQGNSSQSATRDLFGWGTSGYNHGASCYQPWSTSTDNSDYYAYGSYSYNLYDQTGDADWGHNAISNGGNTTNTWRTLTTNEWEYVFKTRSTISGIHYAKACVNNVYGVILLPDDWSTSYYTLNETNSSSANLGSNNITASQWSTLEQHGAVFLPAAGSRTGSSVYQAGYKADYWSASSNDNSGSYVVYFDGGSLVPHLSGSRYAGHSVRLACDVQ